MIYDCKPWHPKVYFFLDLCLGLIQFNFPQVIHSHAHQRKQMSELLQMAEKDGGNLLLFAVGRLSLVHLNLFTSVTQEKWRGVSWIGGCWNRVSSSQTGIKKTL